MQYLYNEQRNPTWKEVFSNYNLFYFFAIVIYTAQATDYTNVFRGFRGNYIAFALPIIFTIIFFFKNKISFKSKGLAIVLFAFAIWMSLIYFTKGRFDLTLALFLLEQIIIAYGIVQVFGKNIVSLYEKIVSKLSFICIIVWGLHLIMPALIENICDAFAIHKDAIIEYNFIFASVISHNASESMMLRNPGVSWEPGMYASLLCIAIICNLIVNKNSIRNRNFYILTLALITTFSTTGYSAALGCIVPYWFLNRNGKSKLIWIFFLVPVFPFIFQLDFMSEKVLDLQSNEDTRADILYRLEWEQQNKGRDAVYVPQRFDGMAFQYLNIQSEPYLGYGLNDGDSFLRININDSIAPSEGIVKLYAQYGLIFGLLLTIIFFKGFKSIMNDWDCKWSIMFFLLYLMLSISYPFYDIPLIMAFLYYAMFKKEAIDYENKTINNYGNIQLR